MAQTELKVAAREEVGKGAARSLRRQGKVPAVVYGKGVEPIPVIVDPKDLDEAFASAGWNALVTLKGEGDFDGRVVMLKDLQEDPIRREALHVDFQAIDLKKKLNVLVPVQPVGRSEGQKLGGSLQVIRHELEVVCLPTEIPKAIEVDVTTLQIGDVVHVEEIIEAQGLDIPHDVNFTVITVTGIKPEEEEAAEVVEEAVEAGEEAPEA